MRFRVPSCSRSALSFAGIAGPAFQRLALWGAASVLALGAAAPAAQAHNGRGHGHGHGERCEAGRFQEDTVCTRQGAVKGVRENGTLAFKGIPYAQPPVGPLRWRPPQPPQPWQGVRVADQFGAICPQLAGSDVVGAEDCLTLNV